MTSMEFLVVVVFALLGYWIVGAFLNRRPPGASNSSANASHTDAEAKARESQQEQAARDDSIADAWYRVLGVPENASKEQITEAYKKMISQYHPDKVAHLGHDLRDLAETKSKQINAAYDYSMKLRR